MKKWIVASLLAVGATQAAALCISPVCTCSVSATSIAFGSYNPLGGALQDANGSVTFSCSGAAGLLIPYSIAINAGSGTMTGRLMKNGTRNLAYNIYSNSNYSTIWGDGTSGAPTISGTIVLNVLGTLSLTSTMYGRIAAGQNTLVPGTYQDTLTVTVTYD
ncbi:spore coat U domain-containing protein [uncultured Oxalicibacterium sp.]|uniref:Csu type fimbrial protein n=1 Tax=uncultured Oxalicibacterium sp. TaxID=1168540 RepID=UPI0025EBFC3E|nr:spore coat U domain-containing protein [uncultured Oxalicibacterium sp.]